MLSCFYYVLIKSSSLKYFIWDFLAMPLALKAKRIKMFNIKGKSYSGNTLLVWPFLGHLFGQIPNCNIHKKKNQIQNKEFTDTHLT